MNTHQLYSLLKNNTKTHLKFQGVFAYDQVPKKAQTGYYIFNLDPTHLPGSHWIAIKIGRKKNFFFDSYGYAPRRYKFKKFLGNKYKFNSKNLQHPLSTSCGQWCMFYIYYSCKNIQPHILFQHFKEGNKLANDHIMNNIIENIFKTNLNVIDKKFLHSQLSKQMKINLKCNKYYCTIKNPRCLKGIIQKEKWHQNSPVYHRKM